MENWLAGPMQYASDGSAILPSTHPDDLASQQLNAVRDYRGYKKENMTPEGYASSLNGRLGYRRNLMNNWFNTPGMIDAGASQLYLGPKTDI